MRQERAGKETLVSAPRDGSASPAIGATSPAKRDDDGRRVAPDQPVVWKIAAPQNQPSQPLIRAMCTDQSAVPLDQGRGVSLFFCSERPPYAAASAARFLALTAAERAF